MKMIFVIFLFLIYADLHGQDLTNTEWTKIEAERKDGSRIIDHSHSDKTNLKYHFTKDSVYISTFNEYSSQFPYSVVQNILSIGEILRYTIDTIDDRILVITELPKTQMPDDKINRYLFINNAFIFDYLVENKQLEIVGDSLIKFNEQLGPVFKGNIADLFLKEIGSEGINDTLGGSFIINSAGILTDIQFNPDTKFSEKRLKKIKNALDSTSGRWDMPSTPHPFQYQINFRLAFEEDFGRNGFTIVGFSFTRQNFKNNSRPALFDIADADRYFNKGMALAQNEEFKKAIDQFLKCLKADSLYLDAYYNIAYCYQKTGNKEMACENWKKLKEMGQKQGEYLFDNNCK